MLVEGVDEVRGKFLPRRNIVMALGLVTLPKGWEGRFAATSRGPNFLFENKGATYIRFVPGMEFPGGEE